MAVATSVALSAPTVLASSHREAPAITRTPTLDAADFYMFMDYTDADDNGMADNPDHVVLMANYVPLQDAYGGPNYFSLDPNGLYEIHIDQNGDGMEDVTFQFQFSQTLGGDGGVALTIDDRDVDIPLKNFGQIDTTDPAASATNFMETYTVAMVTGDRRSGTRTVLNGGMSYDKPMDNIGEKSFADYASYAAGYVHDRSRGLSRMAVPDEPVAGRCNPEILKQKTQPVFAPVVAPVVWQCPVPNVTRQKWPWRPVA